MTFETKEINVTTKQTVYKNVRCDNCNKKLNFVFGKDSPSDYSLQMDNALVIKFHGGYGMFIEEGLPGDYTREALLCMDCAIKLIRAFPFIWEIIKTVICYEPYEELKKHGF